jgi:hypothetical protein
MRSRREVLCKISNKWKSFARCLFFFGAAQIEEPFFASLGMTTTDKTQTNKKEGRSSAAAPQEE